MNSSENYCFIQHFCDYFTALQILTRVYLNRTSLTNQRSHSQERAAMIQESVILVNKQRRSAKTCLILHLTRWTVRSVVDKIQAF